MRRIDIVLLLSLGLMLSGCKLVELKMPGEPMSKTDFALRTQTREFAGLVSSTVQQASDIIALESKDPALKLKSVQWKIGAASSIRSATLRTAPNLALVDAWAFSRQMSEFFDKGPGAQFFGAYQSLAVTNSHFLEDRIDKIAKTLLTDAQYSKMREFVAHYATEFPLRTIAFEREPVIAKWEDFTGAPPPSVPAGTTSEALADFSDRLQAIGVQMPEEVRWRLSLESDEVQKGLERTSVTLDRLDDALKRIGEAAAQSPATVSNAVIELRTGFLPVLEGFQSQWGVTIRTFQQEREVLTKDLAVERAEILKALDQQRAALMKETQDMSRDLVDRSMNHVRTLVHTVLFYAVVLVALILGIPFLAGYFVGRAFGKSGGSKTSSDSTASPSNTAV